MHFQILCEKKKLIEKLLVKIILSVVCHYISQSNYFSINNFE